VFHFQNLTSCCFSNAVISHLAFGLIANQSVLHWSRMGAATSIQA
jgi:hypothetical protein